MAGRHYLTKAELNALYFATHRMPRPKGWDDSFPVGWYCRAALVVFFNYGVDTGTVWKAAPAHEPILWRHVSWGRQSPDREVKEPSRWGWLFYRRVKTGKPFYRPMNRTVHAHIRSVTWSARCPYVRLRTQGHEVNRKRVQRLLGILGLEAIHPRPKRRGDGQPHRVFPYLLRGVAVERPDQVWSADITYLPMSGGFMYLAATIDWYSRYVVAWRLSNTLDGQFCRDMLDEALGRRTPEVFNTDQGVQFTAQAWTDRLEGRGRR